MTSTGNPAQPLLLRALNREPLERPPIWFMRQAGRYLPEYRELRSQAGDFLSLCFNPQMAAEVTLQPMRRFDFDAAIVFADILLIPGALGQKVWFEAGEGPRLGPLPSIESMRERVGEAATNLASIGETLKLVRKELDPEKALIGFAGAPWTVATYMIEGRGGDRSNVRTFAYQQPEALDQLLEILADATADYLAMQVASGAQVLKLFESWAENLPEDLFERVVTKPHQRIIKALRAKGVATPVIGFPRGAGVLLEGYAAAAGMDAVALDVQASAAQGKRIQQSVTIQGALDPLLLRAGGDGLARRVEQMLTQWGDGPYIFNLGHGIILDTPIPHIEATVNQVTSWRR
jgi:uroporphyrinogen decarboxylase